MLEDARPGADPVHVPLGPAGRPHARTHRALLRQQPAQVASGPQGDAHEGRPRRVRLEDSPSSGLG
jgi:hypothetical protein